MGKIVRWLVHDDQTDLYNFLFALVLNLLFLAIITLLLWPLNNLRLAFRLAKGYGSLWLVIAFTTVLLAQIHRGLRMNLYDHANAFVLSNLAVCCLLQAGWSAFAVLTLHDFVTGVPIWRIMILYLIAVFSCLSAFVAVSAVYQGQIYSLFSLPLALISFLIFSLWPASARGLYGWFFAWF